MSCRCELEPLYASAEMSVIVISASSLRHRGSLRIVSAIWALLLLCSTCTLFTSNGALLVFSSCRCGKDKE